MRAKDLLEMGWGADSANASHNAQQADWDKTLSKYQDNPKMLARLKHLRSWKADYAEKAALAGEYVVRGVAHKFPSDANESVIRDREDYTSKLKALYDLERNKDVDPKAVQQRKLDLEQEAKHKGFKEAIDQDEYTNEADMVQNNLATIIRVAEELSSVLEANEDMAEWAQEKIAIVKSMIVTVTDYIISQHEQGNVQHTDEEYALDEKASASLCRSTKRLGRSDYSSCVSQGLRAHSSKGKGHTDGHGNYLKGKKAKSTKYGGDVPDYS
jgi:hypothetical protein